MWLLTWKMRWNRTVGGGNCDRLPYLTQHPISYGSTFWYQFYAWAVSTYFVHSCSDLRRSNGTRGGFIIQNYEPQKLWSKFTLLRLWLDELTIITSGWLHNYPVPKTNQAFFGTLSGAEDWNKNIFWHCFHYPHPWQAGLFGCWKLFSFSTFVSFLFSEKMLESILDHLFRQHVSSVLLHMRGRWDKIILWDVSANFRSSDNGGINFCF